MRLSLSHSWLGATDGNLILGPSLVRSAPARPSRCYCTHTAWRTNLSLAAASCTFGSPEIGHKSLEYLSRRLHSLQSTPEGSEPRPAPLAPAGTATGFEARRLRARQLAEAKAHETKLLRAPRRDIRRVPGSRLREPKPGKVQDTKNPRPANATPSAKKTRLKTEAGSAKPLERGDWDFVHKKHKDQDHVDQFDYWAPATAADALHLDALLKAYKAAFKARLFSRRAENLTKAVLVSKETHREEKAIRQADFARKRAELASATAKQLAMHAAEQERTYEAIRAELRAGVEIQPIYWDTTVRMRRRLRGYIRSPCRICQQPHPLAKCPVLFDIPSPGRQESRTVQRNRRLFEDRLRIDKDFRETVQYLRSNLTVSSNVDGPYRGIVPMHHAATIDAPASAKSEEYLQEFDDRIFFKTVLGELWKTKIEHIALPFSLYAGFYTTTDDDNMPIAVLYHVGAPSNICTDPHFANEMRMIRSFTARWKRGEKSRFGQDPFTDIPSISVIICTSKTLMSRSGRWHRTKSNSREPFRSVISLGISNEQLWNQGLFYKTIHIGTRDDEITSEYDWWSYARVEVEGSTWMNPTAAPVHTSLSQVRVPFARGLLRATVRDVNRSIPPLLASDVKRKDGIDGKRRLLWTRYCIDSKQKVMRKYGRGSAQHQLLKVRPDLLPSKEAREEVLAKGWAPSWETIMRLGQDQREADHLQPRPPRTLRRQRLLRPCPHPRSRPRPSPISNLTARSIFFDDDAAAEKEAVSSEAKRRATSHPRTPRPWTGGHPTRGMLSLNSPSQQPVNTLMMRKRARRRHSAMTRPWSSDLLAKWTESIGSLDTPPEIEAVSPDMRKQAVSPASTPRAIARRTSKYRSRSILSPAAPDFESTTTTPEIGESVIRQPSTSSKTTQSQDPTYRIGGLLSALGITPGTEAVSATLEERVTGGRRPDSPERQKRRRKYTSQRYIE